MRLSSARDLGRPGGGARKIGTSLDLSAGYSHSRNTSLSFYAGAGRWDAVTAFSFPGAGPHPVAHLFSVEIVRLF